MPRFELAPGYSISRLIHGGWQFAAGHRLSPEALDDTVDVLMASAELGVTTFDCADIYTGVESLYGEFLRRWRTTSSATELQVHTKFVPDASILPAIDRAYVHRIIDRSLTRLGVEALDLVQFYWWLDDVPGFEETAIWLSELREAGKIRHLGTTNLDVIRLRRLRDAGVEIVSNQVQYSALDRRPATRHAEWCMETGMSAIAYGALAGGFLTRRWIDQPPPDDPTNRSLVKYRLIIDEYGGWESFQRLLSECSGIADAHEVDLPAVALRYVLDRPSVAAVVSGATRLGQMERNVAAFDFDLTAEDQNRLDRLGALAPGPSGDVFELERDQDGPHGRIMKYNLNRGHSS